MTPNRNRWLPALTLSVLLAVALYLVVLVSGDASKVLEAAARLSPWGWAAILGLSLLNYALRFVRWHLYLRALGHRVPVGQHLAIYLSGFALTTTPGKAGEAIRSLYLHRQGVPYAHSLAALFSERLLDLGAMFALAALGVIALGVNGTWVAAGMLIGGIGVLVVRSPRFIAWVGRLPMPHPRIAHWRNHVTHLLTASSSLLSVRMLVVAMALGIVSWGAEGVGLYLIAEAMAIPMDVQRAIGIYALAMLGGAASLVPGGLGGAEGVMGALLVASGAGLPEAIAATLICRAATLWFAILLGMVSMGILQVRRSWPATTS
jgi:uncharacterized membrane protein YbhN (UPF0104 family)